MHPLLQIAKNLHRSPEGLWTAGTDAATAFDENQHELLSEIEVTSFWFRHRNRCVVELVRTHPPAGTIVDVGGGNGYVTFGLREAGFDAVVIEPGIGGARKAKQRGLEPVLCAKLEDVGFPEGSLAAVGLFDVIEHVPDDAGYFRAVRSLLRPAGMLYLTVPAYQWLWSGEDSDAGHFRRYHLADLIALLNRSGYAVLFASYFFSPLPIPIWLFRTLPTLLGLTRPPPAESAAREHRTVGGVLNRALGPIFDWEVKNIGRGKPIRIGSSCLVAARLHCR